jgi:hypothetical protein
MAGRPAFTFAHVSLLTPSFGADLDASDQLVAPARLTPARALFAALLEQAVADLSSSRHRRSAIAWINGGEARIPFADTCEALGLDPRSRARRGHPSARGHRFCMKAAQMRTIQWWPPLARSRTAAKTASSFRCPTKSAV